MQRNEPKKVLAKRGHILAFRLTRAELEGLNITSENSRNGFLIESAQKNFAEDVIPFAQFKFDFITRTFGRIAEQLHLGWKDSQLEKVAKLNTEELQKMWAVAQVKTLLNTDEHTAEAIVSAAAQQVAGFVIGSATCGVTFEKNSPFLTVVPSQDPKYFDVFIHPADQKVYCIMISSPIYLNLSTPGSSIPEERVFSNASIALYRLDKVNDTMKFKFVYAEFDNEFIYLMAKNQSIPAEVLRDAFFKSPANPPSPVNFEVLLDAAKKDLTTEVQKIPDTQQKILQLQDHCKKYQTHLGGVIAESIGALALQRLSVPTFFTEEPSDVELLAKALLKGGYNGEEDVITALKKGGYERNPRIKIESISPSRAAAILKYQIVSTLLEIIENKASLPLGEVLDKFEQTFEKNQAELERLRDSYKAKGYLKSLFWTSQGEGFVTAVLRTLGTAPSLHSPSEAAISTHQNRPV